MPSDISVSGAMVEDYCLCLPLLTSLYHGDIGSNFKKTFESYVTGENGIVLLARYRGEVGGILIGSYQMDIDWEGKTARIDAIIVNQKNRKMGIGKKLAQSFLNMAKKQSCQAVKSRVNVNNRLAQRFHESLGFARAETYEYTLDFSSQR
jgi:ribosomal protein S18 acetylase RimI-like enzyme